MQHTLTIMSWKTVLSKAIYTFKFDYQIMHNLSIYFLFISLYLCFYFLPVFIFFIFIFWIIMYLLKKGTKT